MTREQLAAVLEGMDVEALRAALLMVGAFARADNAPTEQCLPGPSVAMALWWGLAEALGAPVLPHEVDEAHREATRAAVRARRQVQPSG